MEARRMIVSGRVQGVGFRYFVYRIAGRLGLRGWVRNLADGSVEIHAEGEPGNLAELERQVRRGPSFSFVTDLRSRESVPTGHETFEIRI